MYLVLSHRHVRYHSKKLSHHLDITFMIIPSTISYCTAQSIQLKVYVHFKLKRLRMDYKQFLSSERKRLLFATLFFLSPASHLSSFSSSSSREPLSSGLPCKCTLCISDVCMHVCVCVCVGEPAVRGMANTVDSLIIMVYHINQSSETSQVECCRREKEQLQHQKKLNLFFLPFFSSPASLEKKLN